jgi:hypothetical protein
MSFRKPVRQLLASVIVMAVTCLGYAPVFAQASTATAAHPTGPGSLNGKWNTVGYKGSARNSARDRVHRTVDGKWPPLLPAAAQLLEQRLKMADEGKPFPTTLHACLPGGVPEMIFGSPYLMQFIESPGQITILHEMFNLFRVIYMDASHPADPEPTYLGHSVGRWQGDTLIVDTVGLTDRTSIDEVGTPHSDALHVIERYRRVDNNTLEIIVTLDDPKTFSQPWDVKVTYRAAPADTQYIEYICENNRSGEH